MLKQSESDIFIAQKYSLAKQFENLCVKELSLQNKIKYLNYCMKLYFLDGQKETRVLELERTKTELALIQSKKEFLKTKLNETLALLGTFEKSATKGTRSVPEKARQKEPKAPKSATKDRRNV